MSELGEVADRMEAEWYAGRVVGRRAAQATQSQMEELIELVRRGIKRDPGHGGRSQKRDFSA